jgi:hypothetical protein
MFDDEDRLRDCPDLERLLTHYAQVSGEESAWQDRVGELPGVSSKELVQLHGELIAEGWIEQNTGVVEVRKPGVIAACYRMTVLGRLALRRVAVDEWDDSRAA